MFHGIDDRVIFVKNIEVFSGALFDGCLNFKKLIFSGDTDACPAREQIGKKAWKTLIFFSQAKTSFGITLPMTLEKYTGYLWGDGREGSIYVKK